MRNDVVRIVGPRALVLESFERLLPGSASLEDHAVAAVGFPFGAVQLLRRCRRAASAALRRRACEPWRPSPTTRFSRRIVPMADLRHVVAERVKQPGDRRLRRPVPISGKPGGSNLTK